MPAFRQPTDSTQGLTCESQQKRRQEGGQDLPRCGSHGRRLTVSLVCARNPPPDEA